MDSASAIHKMVSGNVCFAHYRNAVAFVTAAVTHCPFSIVTALQLRMTLVKISFYGQSAMSLRMCNCNAVTIENGQWVMAAVTIATAFNLILI